MPFVSRAQRRYLYANHPDIAKEWEAETGDKPLPERIGLTHTQKSHAKLLRGLQGKSK